MIGRTVSHYRILDVLGSGGMGVVYKAEDVKLGRLVAVKMISENLTDRSAIERFEREARVASSLNHPNICTIYEIGEADGKPFIAMELLEGETLHDVIGRRPMSGHQLLDFAIELATGLAAAHAARMIHRDLKPANVFITRSGHVKILDFGLAKLLTSDVSAPDALTVRQDLTASHAVMGTLAYMSPEQMRGETLDARTDLYSFGALLYEAATGSSPYGRTELVTGDARIDMIVAKATERDRELRYQTADDIRADLRRLKQSAPAATNQRRLVPLAIVCAVLAVALIAGAIIFRRPNAAPAVAPIRSLAVLPFKPIIATDRDEALELGIADTLIAKLSNIRGLTVRPLTAVRRFDRVDQDPIDAGRSLAVDAVLDGTTHNANGRVRVNARLLRVSDSSQLWSGQYDTSFADIFSVYDAISARLADELSVTLTASEAKQLRKHDTENPDAYRAYLLGRYYQSRIGRKNLETALQYFRKAVDADPQYALGYVGIADAYNGLPIAADYPSTGPEEAAKAAATRAIELDPALADAYTSLGFVSYWYDWNWRAAEELFRRSLALNPTYARTHAFYSALLSAQHRDAEAIREGEEALRLEPLNIQVYILQGQTLMQAGRLDDAIEVLRRAFDVDPNSWVPHLILAKAYERKGAFDEAMRNYQFAAAHSFGATEPLGRIGHLQAVRGDAAAARSTLEDLKHIAKQRYVPPYNIALVEVGLGDNESALQSLEQACDERDVRLVFLSVDPAWDPIRSDQRFSAVARRVGLAR